MTDTTFRVLFYGVPFLSLATLVAAFNSFKRTGPTMPEWKQGLCGTAIIFGLVSSLASLYVPISSSFHFGEPLILGMVIIASLLCPVAITMALLCRTSSGYLVIVAELLQGVLVLVCWSSWGSGL